MTAKTNISLMAMIQGRIFWLLLLLLFVTLPGHTEDLTAKINHVNATGFPVVEAMLRVYFSSPVELQTSNLSVFENDQKIENFSLSKQDFQHYLVLAIDRSSSIETAMPDVKAAAKNLIESLAASVSISIISFASDIDIDHSFSNKTGSLTSAIDKIRPWGGTTLFDAIYESCEELQSAAGLNDLKTVICLTDGHDSTPSGQHRLSQRGPEEVTRFAMDKGIRVITLGLGDDIDAEFLGGLASDTGGWYLHTATSDQLSSLSKTLSNRIKLKRHYRLVYNSLNTVIDNHSRNLRVEVTWEKQKATASRAFHIPTKASAQIADTVGAEKLSLDELMDYFEISGAQRNALTEKILLPPAQPVHGLTTASFRGLSAANCRILINQAQQRFAEMHQQNFDMQKSFIEQYLAPVDSLINMLYQKIDASGIKESARENMAALLEYLQLRREGLEMMQQQVYEQYLIKFQTSGNELQYFEKTQVGGEKLNEDFFALNTASQTRSLRSVEAKFADKLMENQQKIEEKFVKRLAQQASPTQQLPIATSSHKLDLSLPRLPQIKTLD